MTEKELEKIIIPIIEKYAHSFLPAKLPNDISRGEVGDCFDCCMTQAIFGGVYKYVEGIATLDGENWFHHAWLTNALKIYALDPTWIATDKETGEEIEPPIIYLGIEFETADVLAFVEKTKMKGILQNRALAPQLFDTILQRAVINNAGIN